MKLRRLSSSGLTLVELLVCMVVASVIIGLLSQVVTSYIHISKQGRFLNLANSYVEGKVEALRNGGYNSLVVIAGSTTTDLTGELPSQLPPSRSASMTVTNPSPGIKQVSLTVSYRDQGKNNSYGYTTYIGELGVGQ
jgi:prepilin-type N-terminal cleavage/methylation domain-containing protein